MGIGKWEGEGTVLTLEQHAGDKVYGKNRLGPDQVSVAAAGEADVGVWPHGESRTIGNRHIKATVEIMRPRFTHAPNWGLRILTIFVDDKFNNHEKVTDDAHELSQLARTFDSSEHLAF